MLGLFKRRKKKQGKKAASYRYLKVKDINKQTADSVTIVFEQPEEKIEYKAGQYITCICDLEDKEERRAYSLSTSPYMNEPLSITIKKEDGGKVSNYFYDHLKPGDELKIIQPMGNFTTAFNEDNQRHLIMIGGGSGITPLMSLITSALEIEKHSFITLIYGNRNEDTIIFKDKLSELEDKYPDRIKVHHVLSRPSSNWRGIKGRLDPETLNNIMKESPEYYQTEFFLCGPRGLMQMVEDTLKDNEVSDDHIHKESFVASSEIEDVEIVKKPLDQPKEVTILYDGEEYTIEVVPGKTILETALDNDIDLPYSCQSGICTTCRCKKLEGEIEMEETEGLTDEELKEGYVLVCVGHPLTKKVKLEVE